MITNFISVHIGTFDDFEESSRELSVFHLNLISLYSEYVVSFLVLSVFLSSFNIFSLKLQSAIFKLFKESIETQFLSDIVKLSKYITSQTYFINKIRSSSLST